MVFRFRGFLIVRDIRMLMLGRRGFLRGWDSNGGSERLFWLEVIILGFSGVRGRVVKVFFGTIVLFFIRYVFNRFFFRAVYEVSL